MHKSIKLVYILLFFLVLVSLATRYSFCVDQAEYVGVAKFFAGCYGAKIRSSHSLSYGIIHAPLILLFKSLIVMKITSLLWLALIILSVYLISHKDKRALLLISVSPIIWYMGPCINSIQLASLLFLWGFFFMDKFDKTGRMNYLIYSGILIGLAWAFWNTVFFILIFFLICSFYNRNLKFLFIFLFFVLIGLLPSAIIDLILYGFPFYSLIKYFFGVLMSIVYGNIYLVPNVASSFSYYLSFMIMLPFFAYTLLSKSFFKERKRQIIFLLLSYLFLLFNPQVRYILFLWPILILYLSRSLNEKQFKIQLIIFSIISFLVVVPYIIQIKYSTNAQDLTTAISNFGNWEISSKHQDKLILEDLENITKEYPNSTFIVGNNADDYAYLANIYWGKNVKEFVSIQDYELYLKNETILFEKKFMPIPKIRDRRQIWIAGGISKNENDDTDYASIKLGLGVGEPINLEGFELVKKYNALYLSEKA